MKKLLLVLMVVALAAFLLVGCIPSTPSEGEGEGEGEAEICPTVAVTTQVAVGGKTYIKGGEQTITVTFAVPTEPISVYVSKTCNEKALPEGIPDDSPEVIMYTTDNLTYTGTFSFNKEANCCEGIIYVMTCNTCAPCKTSFTIDNEGPESEITITSSACVCAGCNLIFKTPTDTTVCGVTTACCGDYCSGFGSYAIDLYTSDPFNECCDIPCITPAYSCPGGVACPVDCTIACVTGTTTDTAKKYYAVVTLLDKVGNRTRYYATIELDSACGVTVTEYPQNKIPTGGTVEVCTDWTGGEVGATIGDCLGAVD